MNETLILILGQTPAAPVIWAFHSEGRVRLANLAENVADLASIASRANAARQVVAILPGECVTMRVIPAPPKTQRQFRAASHYLMEDELAESISNVHMVAVRHESGAGMAFAIKHSVLETWREALAESGVFPDVMTVDFALLPSTLERAVLVDFPDRLLGSAGLQGFAVEKPVADMIAASILSDESIKEIVLYGERAFDGGDWESFTLDWRDPLTDEAIIALYAGALDARPAPNFLQGEYRKKRDWSAAAGPWRRTAALAAACVAGLVFVSVADSVRTLRFAESLENETLLLHQAAFPDAASADPRTHARTVLASSGGGAALFLPISTYIAETLEEVGDVQIDRVRYNAERNEYSVNLRVANVEQLDAFKRILATRGVTATESGSVRRSGGYYLGELRMSLT
ncbi:type II secretion system protein GspL [Hyphococcus sp.]|uniref:type II secretion system protein GspL n=1 Tax=Hyphococcus sp. TaxID=2038636 RepID=UPI003CCBF95D